MGTEHMERSRMDFPHGGRERSMGDGQHMEGGGSRGGPQRIRNVLTRKLVREIYAMRPVKPKSSQSGPSNAMQGFPFFSASSQMAMYGTGASYKESCTKVSNRLAAVYNVNAKTVRDIWNRRSWQAATRDMWTEDEKAQYRSRPAVASDEAPETPTSKNNSPSAGPSAAGKKDQHPPPFHRAGSSSSSSSGSNKTGTTAEASPQLDPQESSYSTPGLTAADREMLNMLQKTSGRHLNPHTPAMIEANAILEQYLARAAGRGGKVDLSLLDQMSAEIPGHLQPTKQEIHEQRAGARSSWQPSNSRHSVQGRYGARIKPERAMHGEPAYIRRVPSYESRGQDFPSPPNAEAGEPFFFKDEQDSKNLSQLMEEPEERHSEQEQHREIPDWQFPSQNTSQDPFNPEWSSLPMW